MAETVEIMVVPVEVIPEVLVEAILVVPMDAVILAGLLPVVTVEGAAHRIVRVVLVHPVVGLHPCPKKK